MKFPAAAFLWLMVPLAAVAGYYGGRHRAEGTAMAAQEQKHSAAGSLPAKAKTGADARPSGAVTRWADRLRHCRAEELPGLYAEIQALAPAGGEFPPDDKSAGLREEWRVALRLLCCRWAELDAPGGLAFLNETLDTAAPAENGHTARVQLLAEWALRDPSAAHRAVMAIPENKRAPDLLARVGSEVMRAGTEPFWKWFKTAREPVPQGWEVSPLWHRLAAAHFEELSAMAAMAAAEQAQAEGDGDRSTWNAAGLCKVLGAFMAGRNAEEALQWAESQPEKVRDAALIGALDTLAAEDPGKALEYLMGIKKGNQPFSGSSAHRMAQKALRTMSRRDPLGALDWFQTNRGRLNGGDSYGAEVLASGLSAAMKDGRITPEQAFAKVSAARSDDGHLHLNVLPHMWRGLPADQLAAAAAWLGNGDAGETRNRAMMGLFPAWAAQNRAAAVKFAAEVKDPEMVRSMFEGLAANAFGGWGGGTADRLATVLKDAPPEHRAEILSRQVRMNLSVNIGDDTPWFDGATLARTLEGLSPTESTGEAVVVLAERWAVGDPVSAMAWASGLADAGLREKALGGAVESWAKEDAWGASQWIDTQPAGQERDMAAQRLARVLSKDDPESAWTWAGSIADPAIRLEARTTVLGAWREASPAAAQAALDQLPSDAGLSPADHQRLTGAPPHSTGKDP